MSTFEEGANQSAEQQPNVTATPDTTVAAPATTQETPVEGIRVKYNKEERIIPNEEAPNWIQKGLNYDKLQERSTQLETQAKNLERVAKAYGFPDVDSYMTALDEFEQQQQLEQEARRLGVDVDVVARFREELNPIKSELDQYKTEMQTVREEKAALAVERELTDLKGRYPDFDKYKDRAFDLAIESGYKLEDAYKLASYEDKIAKTAQQTEAETIRKLQNNALSTPGALGAEGAEHKTGFSSLSKDEQRKMIAEVKAGTRKTL
ncbi:hypothetical protein [Paenibacillus wynnii]|uniref:Scaffolding protein n=1 Tax=Paenibacillus wynnii TaxID=268407 RepID=A0A098MBY2_9BACL|nr:hypothetical protein [Paenibacillus wynnii]KGE20054.1 hypothetical protein PWYN_12430 [Paenibacillus wynnii]